MKSTSKALLVRLLTKQEKTEMDEVVRFAKRKASQLSSLLPTSWPRSQKLGKQYSWNPQDIVVSGFCHKDRYMYMCFHGQSWTRGRDMCLRIWRCQSCCVGTTHLYSSATLTTTGAPRTAKGLDRFSKIRCRSLPQRMEGLTDKKLRMIRLTTAVSRISRKSRSHMY